MVRKKRFAAGSPTTNRRLAVKPGVHTNDFVPIYGRRANKLGHASLTTVFRHSRLTFLPILQENLESPLLRYQPITTAVVTDACLNTRWHHGICIICLERVARYGSGRDNVRGSVGAMNAELSRPDLLATVQLVRKRHSREYVRRALVYPYHGFQSRARLVDRVRPTVPLSYSTGYAKYDDAFPG